MAAKVTGTKAARPRTPPRPPGAAPPAPDDGSDDDLVMDPRVHGFEPVRLAAAGTGARDEVRVPLFYIGATPYTIPAEPGMQVGLEALHITRLAIQRGFDAETAEALAMDYVFDVILGTDGYAALRHYQGKVEAKDFRKITAIAYRLTIGAMELPKE